MFPDGMAQPISNASINDEIPHIDDEDFDDDESDRQTYSTSRSIATSITRYRYENGRRYHAYRDGSYYQPNDERHNAYEVIVHHLYTLTLSDKLYLAPIETPTNVLDVGTGNGLWAIDMADKFPSAQIVGTDLSPTQEQSRPSNVRFEVDDANSEWTYPRDSFDLIHIRGLTGCINDWPTVYAEVYKHLQPGGWFEQVEFSGLMRSAENGSADGKADEIRMDGSSSSLTLLTDDSVFARFTAYMNRCAEVRGKTFHTAENMGDWIREAGFENVEEKTFYWPIGSWSKDQRLKNIGLWNRRNWEDGAEGWLMAMYTRGLGWSKEQVLQYVAELKTACRDKSLRVYHEVKVVYGRKTL